MAVDYTFNHAPLDLCPRMMPSMTKKSKERALKKSEGYSEKDALEFVIDKWKSGSRTERVIDKWKLGGKRGSVRSSITKKGSWRKKKDGDMMEENEINMNSLALGSSESSLKAVNKWKTLRCKQI